MQVSEIKSNPNNPRVIRDERFKKLVKSIEEFPKMMKLRPMIINADNVVIGGNMRLKALQELGYKEIPDDWVKKAEELTEEEQKRFVIADNVSFGEHDFEMLASEWNIEELSDWGVDTLNFEDFNEIVDENIEQSSDEVNINDLSLKNNAFSEEADKLSFSITFNFPISEKDLFDKFDKKELEGVLKNFVYA